MSRIGRIIEWVAVTVERHKLLVVSCYSVVFLITCALLSATKLMWYDEMATYYPAKLPTAGAVVSFFWQVLDLHTPTASLAVRGAITLFGDNPVAARLPVVLGFLVCSICLFVFVVQRCPAVYAFAAMLLPALTGAFYYATEIRCYGIVLGLAGLALICWQAAADGRRRGPAIAGLFLSLASAVCCHYFAIFLWIPLGLAELTRSWIRKQIDWPIWSVLLSSPLVLLIFLHPIRLARAVYAGGMFAKPHLSNIPSSYQSLLSEAFVPLLGVALVYLLLAPRFSRPLPRWAGPALPECVLAATLSLIPFFAVPFCFLAGAFNDRYVLPCVAGAAIVLAFSLCQCLKGDHFVGVVLALIFLCWFVVKNEPVVKRQIVDNGGILTPPGRLFRTSSWSRELERSELPIAASGALFYMQLQHYASDQVRPRIFYLADEQMANRYEGASSTDTNLIRFRRALPLQVVDFHGFISQNSHFLVCADTEYKNWLTSALLDEGAHLQLRSRAEPFYVYEVTLSGSTATKH